MKTILLSLALLLSTLAAIAQGPSPAEPDVPARTASLHVLSRPDFFPEAAEYAFSLHLDPHTNQLHVRVNAAPAMAHARITDPNGNLVHFAPELEVDRGYVFPALPGGSYFLRLDTEEGLPTGTYRLVYP